jgi:hypothetical protein
VRRSLILGVLACIGCDASLGDKPGSTIDARGSGSGGGEDASTILPDAPPSIDAPACSNGRVVYLNFDGQQLTRAATSDATQNRASWMQIASGTAPPFRQGSGTRTQDIQAITDGVRSQLSMFPITVVTQRPAMGEYVMVVFGGQANQVGSNYSLAVNRVDCGDAVANDVAWIADASGLSTQRMINTAIGAIGFGLGLTATEDPNDCMCSWGNTCQPADVACTLSPNIARDQDVPANLACAGLTTQDEQATFRQAFCQ